MNFFKEINGEFLFFTGIMVKNNKQILNPTKEHLLADGWQEYISAPVEPYVTAYEERVEQLIREKYNVNQELAIQRQRDTKVDEFNAYYEYCEECKRIAKEEIV